MFESAGAWTPARVPSYKLTESLDLGERIIEILHATIYPSTHEYRNMTEHNAPVLNV